jgi:hypothetical protein
MWWLRKLFTATGKDEKFLSLSAKKAYPKFSPLLW